MIFFEAQGDPQLLQAIAVFLVALRLGRLQLDAAELLLDLVDDVAKPLQVLIDAFELAQRFGLLGLEAADAGGLLEDGAPVARRGLQKDVDAALLDDAVGVGAGAAAEEQVLDVLEPAGLLIDQVFAFAAAVDPAGDLDFLGVGGQASAGDCRRSW